MNLWESLLEILDEQSLVYQKLIDLMENKQQAIIKDDLNQLEEIVAQEGALAKSLTVLEKKRLDIVGQLAKELDLQDENITLSQLGEYLPEKYQVYYKKLKEKLKDSLKTVTELNKTNEDLLQASLAYVNFSLSLLAGMQNNASYGQQGQEQDSKNMKRSIFDHKV